MRHTPVNEDLITSGTPVADCVADPVDARDGAPASRHRASLRADVTPPPAAETAARPSAVRKLLRKQIAPLLIMACVGWLLWDNIAALNFATIGAVAAQTAPAQWGMALTFTAISFWAVGRYDAVLHAQLDTGISREAARRTGIAAIGLSQFLGFGALTGSLIRWRLLPELSLWQSVRLSGAIALSFLAGWAVVAALAVLLFQPPLPWMKSLASLAIGIATCMALISVYPPKPLVRWPWPTLRTMGAIIGLAAIDTVFAGATFFVLLPAGVAAQAVEAIPAYLFALGAGLVGSTPGGVGPFEATLAALLPDLELEVLLGAVLAFRVVYYLIPASLSALVVLAGPRPCNLSRGPQLTRTQSSPFLPPEVEKQLFQAPRAEANLLRTRDFSILSTAEGQAVGLAAPIGQSLVMLSDPLEGRGCPDAARMALSRAAHARYRIPAIYKCGPRMAAAARRAGWRVVPSAEEAWLVPENFTLDGARKRQLRRFLRKASDSGLDVREAPPALPLDAMDRVAAHWRDSRGGERGFSMGTYTRDYVRCQRVFLAYFEGALVGFVTFHESRFEITLDLIRVLDSAPEGTVQALIVEAIATAAAQGCPRLSLAAAPWAGEDRHPFVRRLRLRVKTSYGGTGLRRFKGAFDPTWETLYFAAPNAPSLGVAGIDIVRRITAPPPEPTTNLMRANRFATHPVWRLFRRKTHAK